MPVSVSISFASKTNGKRCKTPLKRTYALNKASVKNSFTPFPHERSHPRLLPMTHQCNSLPGIKIQFVGTEVNQMHVWGAGIFVTESVKYCRSMRVGGSPPPYPTRCCCPLLCGGTLLGKYQIAPASKRCKKLVHHASGKTGQGLFADTQLVQRGRQIIEPAGPWNGGIRAATELCF